MKIHNSADCDRGSGLAGQLRGSALFVLSQEDHISFPEKDDEKVWTE